MASMIFVEFQLKMSYHMSDLIAIYFDELGHVGPLELTKWGNFALHLDLRYFLDDKSQDRQSKKLN